MVTANVGPRIIYFGRVGGHNFLKNLDRQMGLSGEADWMIRGGSRIWIAPEDRIASYAPDNQPVQVEVSGNTLAATAPVEEGPRVQKQMVIRVSEQDSGVEVVHRVRNCCQLPSEFAVWVLTVMAPGGTAVTGLPPRGTHPEKLAPSNPLIIWPFTGLSGPRWRFLRKYLLLEQDLLGPSLQKIGHFDRHTWGGYFLNGDLFVKRCVADPTRAYPDLGSSFEMFTNAEMCSNSRHSGRCAGSRQANRSSTPSCGPYTARRRRRYGMTKKSTGFAQTSWSGDSYLRNAIASLSALSDCGWSPGTGAVRAKQALLFIV